MNTGIFKKARYRHAAAGLAGGNTSVRFECTQGDALCDTLGEPKRQPGAPAHVAAPHC